MSKTIIVCDATEAARVGARMIAECLEENCRGGGQCRIALSGGSTPKAMYEILGSPAYATELPWKHLHVFFGDERFVPHTSPESNYRMAREAWLDRVAVPADQVHPIPTSNVALEEAASRYEAVVRRELAATSTGKAKAPAAGASAVPVFDLMLLGMGDDGHTASLFPGTDPLSHGERLVIGQHVEKVGMGRISMTPRLINAAAHVLLVVTGEKKAAVLGEILNSKETPAATKYPVVAIAPNPGDFTWLLDEAAATQVRRHRQHAL